MEAFIPVRLSPELRRTDSRIIFHISNLSQSQRSALVVCSCVGLNGGGLDQLYLRRDGVTSSEL